jgi:hypothetical protein
VEFGFGGAAVDYAILQHEAWWFNHPRGGTWKYLEKAVQDHEPKVQDRLEQPMRSELRKYNMRGSAG